MAEENTAQVSDAVSTLNNMNFLRTNSAWLQLVEVLDARYEPLAKEVLYTPTPDNNVYAREFARGELKAWKFITTLPMMMAEEAQDVLTMIKAQAEENDNGESS